MASSRRLNLNGVQVFAGVLATITGAIAASYLGVGGTLVGAAIGSLASTVGGEVYRHYLERTHDRLRSAVDVHRYRNARSTVVGQVDPAVAQKRLGVTSRREEDASAAAETQVLPVQPPGGPGHGGVISPRPTSPNDPLPHSATETFGATVGRSPDGRAETAAAAAAGALAGAAAGSTVAGAPAAGSTVAGAAAAGSTEAAGATAGSDGKKKRPRWVILTAITVGTFLVALAVITVIELSVGKTLHAIVTNRPGTGTTVGGVVGGQNTSTTKPTPATTATPTTVPAGSSSATAPVSATPPATSAGATPTPSPSITPGAPNDPLPTPTPAS
jgi:hypothetical protein